MNYLVTGANRGLGLEFVKQLLEKEDNHVIATARNLDDATELLELAASPTGRLRVETLDISDAASIEDLRQRLKDERIDCLINNAGRRGIAGDFPNLDIDKLEEDFRTNTVGTIRMCQAFIPHLTAGSEKKIVNISTLMSSIQDNTSGGDYSYRISKTALNMASVSMARDLADHGFRVYILHPGWVQTDMGGPHGKITTDVSVKGMLEIIERGDWDDTAVLVNYDGKHLPW